MDSAVITLPENHGYLAVAVGDSSVQVFLTADRYLLGSPNKTVSILVGLIGVYFSFNIAYPKPLYPILLFLQHFVLNITDSQHVPDIVKRVVSSLDRIEV